MRILTLATFAILILVASCDQSSRTPRVLVFTKTSGYYHESIPTGVAAIQTLGAGNQFAVDTTKDANTFTEANLRRYDAVIFLSTTGNVLDADQQVAFERYIQAGGGYVGIHAAADTEYEWPWYNKLAGAYFQSHPNNPNVRKATIDVVDTTHHATQGLPARWERNDEWYNYRNINPNLKVIATLDESTYEGGENGEFHPIAWYHEYDGGRAFYTGGGHTTESFSEPLFLKHLLGGIRYAIGKNVKLDYAKAYAVKAPEENRFVKTVLSNDLNEPMELAVAPDGRVFFIERGGNFYVYDPGTKATTLARRFAVMPDSKDAGGNGLLGITIDPDFESNNYIYFFYTPRQEPAHQNVSRFIISRESMLDTTSEQVIIQIPIDLENSAHTGGSLAWDKAKNLYISTGDNTVPFNSDGFAPIDEIPGRKIYDAQRSSSNTNDLRGKILRIHPEKDGTYTIPKGNLFAEGTPLTKPEIFVMGCRNPYRICVDAKTSIVYWGEIGPDSGKDGPQGPKGYDEFNQARDAGYFGWPYFVGDNKPYHDYDFASKTVGALFDEKSPVNESPNSNGAKKLPAPRKAMIWYPYDRSPEFQDLGTGGRSAMAGQVYHYDDNVKSDHKFPKYFDQALFVFDWMRNWVFAVRLDEKQNFKRLEQFMPVSGDFRRPIDMQFGADGSMYMLEYGSVYGIDNVDARLVRITYNAGNRAPRPRIALQDSVGQAPLTVAFKNKSEDFDEETLSYTWTADGQQQTSENFQHTFSKNGVYPVVLSATDPKGLTSRDTVKIYVGNTTPVVEIETPDNPTFFFASPLRYQVVVKDGEDRAIDQRKINVQLKYISRANPEVVGHQPLAMFSLGKSIMQNSDCKACHQINAKSVGPAFVAVAERYKDDKLAVEKLANKVIKGGGGVWGEHAMNAHPQLSKEDAMEVVKYVLSLGRTDKPSLPAQGQLRFNEHQGQESKGRYVLAASYTDAGGATVPLTGKSELVLRPARLQAEDADQYKNMWRGDSGMGAIHHNSYIVFKKINLRRIKGVVYHYASENIGATIEIRKGSVRGPVTSSVTYKATGSWDKYQDAVGKVEDPGGVHDLYFVFRKDEEPNRDMCNLDWIEFKL